VISTFSFAFFMVEVEKEKNPGKSAGDRSPGL